MDVPPEIVFRLFPFSVTAKGRAALILAAPLGMLIAAVAAKFFFG